MAHCEAVEKEGRVHSICNNLHIDKRFGLTEPPFCTRYTHSFKQSRGVLTVPLERGRSSSAAHLKVVVLTASLASLDRASGCALLWALTRLPVTETACRRAAAADELASFDLRLLANNNRGAECYLEKSYVWR